MFVLAELRWPILERIPLVGDLAVSPHGIAVAVGFLVGANVMLRRAKRRGVGHHHVSDVEEQIQTLMLRAAVGGIIGARFFYIATRPDLFPDPLAWFRVWEGGLSLLGGIAGAVLAGVPFARRRGYSLRLLLDSVAPGLALGIFVGRFGDLIIGEHLGDRTSFVLGWRCTGAVGDPAAPHPWPGEPGLATYQGCFDTAVHQTALYDLLTGGVVFAILVLLERKPRFDGFFLVAFAVLYGSGRFVSDFARAADRDLLGPLTGSQLTSLAVIAVSLGWVLLRRPDREPDWAWCPPDFRHPWDPPEDEADDAGENSAGRTFPSDSRGAGTKTPE